jgi:hypothetical protein
VRGSRPATESSILFSLETDFTGRVKAGPQIETWQGRSAAAFFSPGPAHRADLSGLIDSLMAAQRVEIYRRNVTDPSTRRLLDRLANCIVKILTQTRMRNPSEEWADIGRLRRVMVWYLPAILRSSNSGSSARPAYKRAAATGATSPDSWRYVPKSLNRIALGDLQSFAQSLVQSGFAPVSRAPRWRRTSTRIRSIGIPKVSSAPCPLSPARCWASWPGTF